MILIQSFSRSSGTCFVRAGHSVKPSGAILVQLSSALGTPQPSHSAERHLILVSLKIINLLSLLLCLLICLSLSFPQCTLLFHYKSLVVPHKLSHTCFPGDPTAVTNFLVLCDHPDDLQCHPLWWGLKSLCLLCATTAHENMRFGLTPICLQEGRREMRLPHKQLAAS